jgi:hypothetical protein
MNKRNFEYRILEIIPGFVTWCVLAMPFVLSFLAPIYLAYFILIFDLYWMVKAAVFGVRLISSYKHMKREARLDWRARCVKISQNLDKFIEDLKHQLYESRGFTQLKLREELNMLIHLQGLKDSFIPWDKIRHFIILPTYGESYETLEASLSSYAESDYPKSKIVVVLAIEGREGEPAKEKVARLERKFSKTFGDLFHTIHPDGLSGELKAKGANATWAAHEIERYAKKHEIPTDHIMISTFDSDTRTHPKYFANLTYKYITNPDRDRRSYQPIPLFSNNIWETRSLMRLNALSSTFWQMIESTRPWRLVNFSSQAMSLKTLIAIDFWDVSIISEDSRQYYRAFFKFEGDHLAIPLFTPVYMDAVLADTFWKTLRNQYLQKRRWAWGVEHFPYLVLEVQKHPEIAFWKKAITLYRHFEGTISWSTSSLLIAMGAWLPIILNPAFRNTVLAYNVPLFASYLLSLTWIGLIMSAAISMQLLPPRPKKYGPFKTIKMVLQWILVPIHTIFFGSIPAIDAQTRLMFGKYLGFWVTPKHFVKRDK